MPTRTMKSHRISLYAILFGALLLLAFAVTGCARLQEGLDQVSPSTQPGKPEPLSQTGRLLIEVSNNPTAQEVARTVPFGGLSLELVGLIGLGLTTLDRHLRYRAKVKDEKRRDEEDKKWDVEHEALKAKVAALDPKPAG